jgi:hypothetical protein
LGGCAVMAEHLDRIIRQPWNEIRKIVTGSTGGSLHANTFSRTARREDIEAVAGFFHAQPFARFGAIISEQLPQELGPVPAIAKVLQKRVVEIAQLTSFKEVRIIF